MKIPKNVLILVIAFVVIIAGAIFANKDSSTDSLVDEMNKISQEHPEWTEFTSGVLDLTSQEIPTDENKIVEYYLKLGLAWKSLADRTREADHYLKALEAYNIGIDISDERNLVFLNNAGNMAKYAKDYELSKYYFEKSTENFPGDGEAYVNLAELHSDFLGSDRETVIGVYDKGIKRMLDPTALIDRKNRYLNSLEE
jgi:tetratricopeptide (TPR) repeat protein